MEASARLIAREGQRKSEDRTASPPRGANRSRSSDPERSPRRVEMKIYQRAVGEVKHWPEGKATPEESQRY